MVLAQLQRIVGRDAGHPARAESPGRALCRRHQRGGGVEQIAVDIRRLRQADLRFLVVRRDREYMLEARTRLLPVALGQRQPGHPVQRFRILGVDGQQALIESTRLVKAVLAAGDPRQPEDGRARCGVARQDLLVDLARLTRVLRLQGEAKLKRRIRRLGRNLMGFAQVGDRALAVSGVARHDSQQHVGAVVCRAGGNASCQQAFNRGCWPRLLAEQALCFIDLAVLLTAGAGRHSGEKNPQRQQSAANPPRRRPVGSWE